MRFTFIRIVGLLPVVLLFVGCGEVSENGGLGPMSSYREQQLDRALDSVSVVEGLIVPEPAPALADGAIAALISESLDFLNSGLRPPAIERAVAAVRGAPGAAAPYAALGRALLTTRRTPVALAAFATAVERDPDDVEARFLHGLALDRLGRRTEAMEEWQRVVSLDPDHGGARTRLAAACFLEGDLGAAAEHLHEAQRLGAQVPGHLAEMIANGVPREAVVVVGHRAGSETGAAEAAVVGEQVQLNPTLGSRRANETSAAAGIPGEVVAGWNEYPPGGGVVTGVSVSLDGSSWSDQVVRAPAGHQADTEGDPMTAADPRTGTLWIGAISFDSGGGVFVARKNAGSATFLPSVLTLESSYADKGWMAAGPRPGLPETTSLYVAYNLGLQRSEDLGETWSAPVSLGSGVGYLPRVGPDGTVYVANWDYAAGHWLRRSTDGGQTVGPPIRIATIVESWDLMASPQIPGDFRTPPLASLAVDPVDETLYCAYPDSSGVVGGNTDVDIYLTTSEDSGATWSTPVVVTADPAPPGDQFFPWIEVTSDGRVHLFFLDSSFTIQNDSASSAWLDAVYSWSDDRGATWTSHRLTGSSFDTGLTNLGSGEFIGDYTGMAALGDRVWPVYLSTEHGIAGVYSHEILSEPPLFGDDFETGGTGQWGFVDP